MRKFYAFIAAALMSVSMLATPSKIPTVAELTGLGYDVTNNVVLCFYFDGEATVCGDIVLTGTINGWSEDPTKCPQMEALEGQFEGWYAYEFAKTTGDDRAKPIHLKDGAFSWDYQPGDPEAWVNMNVDGSKEITLALENGAESSVLYPSAGAYIYNITYWKNHKSPCVVVPKHKYTIVFFAPECEYVVPALVGAFDNWAGTAMNKTTYDGDEAYVLEIEDEEGHEFKFFDLELKWSNELFYYDTENEYWTKYNDNFQLPVATKDTTLVYDCYDELENPTKFKWPLCVAPEEASTVGVALLAPAGAPVEGIDIIGTFDDWAGLQMDYDVDLNAYTAVLTAKSTDSFKFRQHGTWDNQIQYKDELDDAWKTFGDGNAELKFGEWWEDGTGTLAGLKIVALDFSDPAKFKWQAWEESIENVVLTEKAQKVVIDGVLYIIRDNKMYNAQGTQVR